jgi:hypothetical protein
MQKEETHDQAKNNEEQSMAKGPAGSKDAWQKQGGGFVEEIGENRTEDTERKSPPVIRQVPESEADQGTKKDVGKYKHPETLLDTGT